MSDNLANQHHKQQTIEARLDELCRRGILVPSGASKQMLQPVARRPGALARFLLSVGDEPRRRQCWPSSPFTRHD